MAKFCDTKAQSSDFCITRNDHRSLTMVTLDDYSIVNFGCPQASAGGQDIAAATAALFLIQIKDLTTLLLIISYSDLAEAPGGYSRSERRIKREWREAGF